MTASPEISCLGYEVYYDGTLLMQEWRLVFSGENRGKHKIGERQIPNVAWTRIFQ